MKIEVDGKSIYECSKEELKEVGRVLKQAYDLEIQKSALHFNPGMKVFFDHKGKIYSGSVEKVNQKTITVKTNEFGTWNVSPHLLKIKPEETPAG